jgi:hypothetical protein
LQVRDQNAHLEQLHKSNWGFSLLKMTSKVKHQYLKKQNPTWDYPADPLCVSDVLAWFFLVAWVAGGGGSRAAASWMHGGTRRILADDCGHMLW